VVVPAKGQGQDRVAVIRTTEAVVLAVADGSGGMRGGAEAAEHAVRMISNAAQEMIALDTQSFVSLITRIDTAPAPGQGQCALVVAAIVGPRIVGASAGDCGAWLITDSINDLTEQQVRKPLVGSGSAVPVPFEAELGLATLLLASDGLLKYARRNQIAALARGADLNAAAQKLADLPRLRSGDLPDDLAVVVCRARHG
jgi:serine/threonine protein phosphatase PrpC